MKPLRGIRQLNINDEHKKILFSNTVSTPFSVLEGIVIDGIQRSEFIKENADSFYLCRYSYEHHVCVGIIGKIDCRYVNKRIFKHEECCIEKQSQFHKDFVGSKIQVAPALLTHKENIDIESYLKSIIRNTNPDSIFYIQECKYEIWVLHNTKILEELYNSIDLFCIADGHHRISYLTKFYGNALAYIIPDKYLRSYPILRRYCHLSSTKIQELLEKIQIRFSLKKFDLSISSMLKNENYILSYNMQKFNIVSSSSNDSFKQILETFSCANFSPQGSINFKNFKLDLDCIKVKNSIEDILHANFDLYIPTIRELTTFIAPDNLLPIHSTWFEPKIPPGIIGMEIFELS